jgi:hypothetical protein
MEIFMLIKLSIAILIKSFNEISKWLMYNSINQTHQQKPKSKSLFYENLPNAYKGK